MGSVRKRKSVVAALEAVSHDPQTFRGFIRNLQPADLQDAWELVAFLYSVDERNAHDCSHILGDWCVRCALENAARQSPD